MFINISFILQSNRHVRQ